VEVVKVGLIWDASFFRFLEDHLVRILGLEREPLRQVVSRSCAIKAEIVSQDEREKKGVRTLLNFGHTFGHALEAATGFSRLTHGEAVAIGILCAAWVSVTLGMLARSEYDRIEHLLKKMGMDTRIREVDANRVWEAMKRDKKFLHGRNRFVLLEGAGRARIVENVDAKVLGQALEAHLA
jgi:3-dehydroquinate synthase